MTISLQYLAINRFHSPALQNTSVSILMKNLPEEHTSHASAKNSNFVSATSTGFSVLETTLPWKTNDSYISLCSGPCGATDSQFGATRHSRTYNCYKGNKISFYLCKITGTPYFVSNCRLHNDLQLEKLLTSTSG